MLNDFNLALDDPFGNADRYGVMLNGVVFRFCADIVNCFVEEIALGRLNLSDSPIIAANIFLCGEFAVLVGGVGINQLIAVIDAVLCSSKRSVALCLLCFSVGLFYGYGKLLQNIDKFTFSRLVPNNRCSL